MRDALLFAILTVAAALRISGETLTQQIDPAAVNVGDEVTVSFTFQGGGTEKIVLPPVEGLQLQPGASTVSTLTSASGMLSRSVTQSFRLIPTHSGDFIIPAFEITAADGSSLRTKPLKLQVVVAGTSIPISAPSATVPDHTGVATAGGPVVMPPNSPAPVTALGDGFDEASDPYASVPKDVDGGPAKVFLLISLETTDAYVGQAVPLQIDFFIRMEARADQLSLPTIKGSDFLMNNFSMRGRNSLALVENMQYERDTWRSAIAAPKSGDFPLAAQRQTYWVKSSTPGGNLDPFAGFLGRHQDLAHEMVSSNQLTIHVHPLPEEGRPPQFTGAVGQFKVVGGAAPSAIAAGEPVKLGFNVSGVGNFDHVRCPAFPDDPAWKKYVATSKTSFLDESRTRGVKIFEQSLVPQRNGTVPLQTAIFCYFDPTLKQYVTTPISLPDITVSGEIAPSVTPAATGDVDAATATAAAAVKVKELTPNRLAMGRAFANLTPAYQHTWFWKVQAVLLVVALLGGLFLLLRPSIHEDREHATRIRLGSSRQQEELAMREAVERNDAPAFFIAARHAVQLQLGSQRKTSPEALTLSEIRRRDPALAESLAPFFQQADEVIYSGCAPASIDLAVWDRTVREILKPHIATV